MMILSPEESAKEGALLRPRLSSVCVGVDKDTDGEGDLPRQVGIDVHAARVAKGRSSLLTCRLL